MKDKTRKAIKKVNKELVKEGYQEVQTPKENEKHCSNCGQKALIQTGTCHTCHHCGESAGCG